MLIETLVYINDVFILYFMNKLLKIFVINYQKRDTAISDVFIFGIYLKEAVAALHRIYLHVSSYIPTRLFGNIHLQLWDYLTNVHLPAHLANVRGNICIVFLPMFAGICIQRMFPGIFPDGKVKGINKGKSNICLRTFF